MQRISSADVERRAESVSAMLRGLEVRAQQRNGATALDLYDAHGCVRMLTIGTRRETYDYLGAMAEALYLVGREHDAIEERA